MWKQNIHVFLDCLAAAAPVTSAPPVAAPVKTEEKTSKDASMQKVSCHIVAY